MKPFLFLALLPPLLAGCATSTIESRKQERYGAYSELTSEQRAAVDAGRIGVGMPMDAVYIAWGKPQQVVSGEGPAGAFTSWLYHGTFLHGVTYWAYQPYYGRRYHHYGPTLRQDYVPVDYVSGEVVFDKGLVKQWRTLPAPSR